MMLEVSGLTVKYGDLTVVRDLSMKLEQGSFTAMVGANGAGKSTIINAISGALEHSEGSIKFLDKSIGSMKPNKRVELGIVQIPEGRLLFGGMTVLENLQLGAYTKNARREIKATLNFVYSLFPRLADRKMQIARTLSGGEQQMLAIARGLMSKPSLLILDEPTWGLAPKLVMDVLQTIKKINNDGITILLVEQHIQQCLRVADNAHVVENGRIVISGSGAEVLCNSYVKKAYLGL